jgi:TorA maturation chaperone TorD
VAAEDQRSNHDDPAKFGEPQQRYNAAVGDRRDRSRRVGGRRRRSRAAQEYALLATLLSRSPDDRMLGRLALLRGDASPLGAAHTALAEAAAKANAKSVKAEYFDLFDGLGRNGFLPYAFYYLTGSLYGRPLARLRQAHQRLGIEWAEHLSEPILGELMASLAGGQIAVPVEGEREIFETHLAPWIGRFFADLERAESASFLRARGRARQARSWRLRPRPSGDAATITAYYEEICGGAAHDISGRPMVAKEPGTSVSLTSSSCSGLVFGPSCRDQVWSWLAGDSKNDHHRDKTAEQTPAGC